jgi:hypothetical protein
MTSTIHGEPRSARRAIERTRRERLARDDRMLRDIGFVRADIVHMDPPLQLWRR